MPIYEYACKKCGDVFEVIQSFKDPPLKKHEDCGGKVEKLVSMSAFHLKGDGWYVTDYARKGQKDEDGGEKSEAKSESKSSDGDSKKAETKKADKKPAKSKAPAKAK